MASANVKSFNDQNWKAEVLDSSEPVLVDFWAEWCGPCRALAPTIDKVADQFAGKVKVGKVNTDEAREVPMKYGIMSIPTMILFKGGKDIKRLSGFGPRTESELVSALNAALAS